MIAYTTHNVINGQIVSMPEPGQIIKDIDNFTQYEHLSNPQSIGYVEEEQVRGITDQQQDIVEAEGGELKDFKLDMKVRETQGMDAILAEFTTIDSMPDVASITTEEFNMIFNFCSGVFELQLSCNGNGSV